MPSREQQRQQMEQLVRQAEREHDDGELTDALKTYKRAYELTQTKEEKARIEKRMQELREMAQFVSAADSEGHTLGEDLAENVKANIRYAYGAGIFVVICLLAVFVLGPLLSQPTTDRADQTFEDLSQDKVGKGDSNNVDTLDEFGANPGGTGGANAQVEDKEGESRLSFHIPEAFLDPYPTAYVGKADTPWFADASAQTELGKLPLNAQVEMHGKQGSDQNPWIEVVYNQQTGWIAAEALSDNRIQTPEEVDAEIKARLGGRYWEVQVEGKDPPFDYFLYVNAPTARLAYEGAISGYSSYASRQMLDLVNTHSHVKTKQFEVEAAEPQWAPDRKGVVVPLKIFATNEKGERSEAGSQTITIPLEKGRFVLRMPLETR